MASPEEEEEEEEESVIGKKLSQKKGPVSPGTSDFQNKRAGGGRLVGPVMRTGVLVLQLHLHSHCASLLHNLQARGVHVSLISDKPAVTCVFITKL